MTTQLPALPIEASPWDQALYAFLVEKRNRSRSQRTVESYSRMLWHFFKSTTPDQVTPAVVLARHMAADDAHVAIATQWSVPLPLGAAEAEESNPRDPAQ